MYKIIWSYDISPPSNGLMENKDGDKFWFTLVGNNVYGLYKMPCWDELESDFGEYTKLSGMPYDFQSVLKGDESIENDGRVSCSVVKYRMNPRVIHKFGTFVEEIPFSEVYGLKRISKVKRSHKPDTSEKSGESKSLQAVKPE